TRLVNPGGHRVYVSYSPHDSEVAGTLVGGLLLYRMGVFRDEDYDAMQHAEALVVLLSPISAQSAQVTEEWYTFYRWGRPVIPVVMEACPVPSELSNSPYLITYHGDDRQLVEDVRNTVNSALA